MFSSACGLGSVEVETECQLQVLVHCSTELVIQPGSSDRCFWLSG